ncbi:DUF3391 domain-containing protein [Methylomonas sp. SURF-1]|uniref:DUF3391 domain-containing protein n=1 Tax=Methylomonas aurea TaxID=2952224 RepID=A0ABT1UDW1_9GAMM|nr:HD-GYP domain-containing protein [Methylomonas sp. SURF-1]MCQ8180421.1 DUF3391 domain-containing protein [Methylomonas sp. SURF-1]
MEKKISVSQLRKGMYLCATDRKWLDLPFFATKFLIRSDAEIDTLRQYCREVSIDLAKGLDVAEPEHEVTTRPDPAAVPELEPLRQFRSRFEIVLDRIRTGSGLDYGAAEDIACDIVHALDSCGISLNGIEGWRLIGDRVAHKSVNVCVLAAALARRLSFSPDLMRHTAIGALLHDLGLLTLPQAIIGKSSELTDAERLDVRQHVAAGLALLAEVTEVPGTVVDVVRDHHERPDGAGYPRGLAGGQIGLPARMVGVASVYEALLSDRADRAGQVKVEALRYLYQASPAQFDAAAVAGLIEVLNVYPPGCVVELSNGALAMVDEGSVDDPSRPPCRMIADSKKQLLFQEQRIDLSQAAHSNLSIARLLAPDEPFIELLASFAAMERI